MKRVFIIHGWEGSPDANWLPWLKAELEKRKFLVEVPAMPDTDSPVIEAWVSHLAEIVGVPDEDTYFVGHSIGCQAILRYCQSIQARVGGVLCVAGWFSLMNMEEEEKEVAEPWLTTPMDLPAVRKAAPKMTAIFSDDDPFVPLSDEEVFKEKLGAEIVVEHGKGHFTGEEDGATSYPIILEEFLKLAGNHEA